MVLFFHYQVKLQLFVTVLFTEQQQKAKNSEKSFFIISQ